MKALRASLSGWSSSPRDGAAVQLAKRYAALLDASAIPSSYRAALDRMERLIRAGSFTKADQDAFTKIREALSAHTVASDLGPKYLAALASLGMTPAARDSRSELPLVVEPAPDPDPVPEGKADELRKRREQRARRADGAG